MTDRRRVRHRGSDLDESPVVVITGANTGIGLETAVALAASDARVFITSRDLGRGRAAVEVIRDRTDRTAELVQLDLGSFASIRACVGEIQERMDRLDVLINNAGVSPAGKRWLTAEGFEATIGVNHIGPFLLTSLLLDLLKASAPSRIVMVSSGAHRVAADGLCFDDLQHEHDFHSMQVYGESKLANIYFTRELARRLDGTGVTVNALNPGYVATQLGQHRAEDSVAAIEVPQQGKSGSTAYGTLPEPLTPAEGAEIPVMLATDPALAGVTGAYFDRRERAEPNLVALDDAAARRLWDVTERLIAKANTDPG